MIYTFTKSDERDEIGIAEESVGEESRPPEEDPSKDQEIAKLRDELVRALADADNLRKRTAREKEELSRYAVARFARDLLAVLDSLHHARNTIADPLDKSMKALSDGLELTQREFERVMGQFGVHPVRALGVMFDPHLHQAVAEVDGDGPSGAVFRVLQDGYVIHDRLLRPALVEVVR